jgi:hypothetical protein
MGFSIGKAFEGATRVVSDTIKGAAKVTSKVFSSRVFNMATTAMCFIPGFNVAGGIGKAFAVLGKTQAVQNWIKTGLSAFKAIKDEQGLSDSVKGLIGGQFQPLGALSKFSAANAPLFGPNPTKLVEELQGKAELLKQFQKLPDQSELMKQLTPIGLVGNFEGQNFVKTIANAPQRIQSAIEMMQELQKNLTPSPMFGSNYIVRA